MVVKTSDIRGAGTDANVSLCIFGEHDGKMLDTGTHKLDNSANNFERGANDTFMIKSKDVGEVLKRVVVSQCSLGLHGREAAVYSIEVYLVMVMVTVMVMVASGVGGVGEAGLWARPGWL